MKLDIKETKKNAILGREEITATLNADGSTPRRTQIIQAAVKQLKAKQEMIIVKSIKNDFGSTTVNVLIHKYDNKEALDKLEPEYLRKKHEKKDKADASSDKADDSGADKEVPKEEADKDTQGKKEE